MTFKSIQLWFWNQINYGGTPPPTPSRPLDQLSNKYG